MLLLVLAPPQTKLEQHARQRSAEARHALPHSTPLPLPHWPGNKRSLLSTHGRMMHASRTSLPCIHTKGRCRGGGEGVPGVVAERASRQQFGSTAAINTAAAPPQRQPHPFPRPSSTSARVSPSP
ncbi:hypothetical protein E2C01_001679 [Portunus trituberculatus]|uniref:Uncharacterized protein n=1 Tax=Portunus trituberculatus TaxID=210409 RepID=A0A5B7CL05_PORTR|nr:hypothetical protein [Portunus trituberculatus]